VGFVHVYEASRLDKRSGVAESTKTISREDAKKNSVIPAFAGMTGRGEYFSPRSPCLRVKKLVILRGAKRSRRIHAVAGGRLPPLRQNRHALFVGEAICFPFTREKPPSPGLRPPSPARGEGLSFFAASRGAVFLDCFVAFAPRNDADFSLRSLRLNLFVAFVFFVVKDFFLCVLCG
jgi:hypothetical protein